MKLAYVTHYDATNLKGSNEWSGTGYYIAEALKRQHINLDYIGPLKDRLHLKILGKCKRHYYELFRQRYINNSEPIILKNFANQISNKLIGCKVDAVFSATTNPISYLDCDLPIVFWADATFANILDFYPLYSHLCDEAIRDGHLMEQIALEKCSLAIYSSDWAAQNAIKYYKANPSKVKVIPFGANITEERTLDQVRHLVESRSSNKCKILFLAVDWFRKGGDVAFKVAKTLNEAGLKTELTIVGCDPILDEPIPDFVKPLGFINKSTDEGKAKINRLFSESHLLILPSLADCSPIVLCEANSFGVPCLATKVGGIPTIIRDDINGRLFETKANVREYCDYIIQLFYNYNHYKQLALSSFNEYQSRLNWSIAGKSVQELLGTILS
ncbi:group 1 glycosyl transferase [Calothrix sp. NIES-4101]|nr:group 1 glycosyl transferase [Calothrix sp. NIES-4101]